MTTKFLRFHDLVDAGIVSNRTTLSRWVATRGFPKPMRLGPNTRAWPEDEVMAWVEAQRVEAA